jgi:glycosyltransferase involved in cell wall biosynthesis
VSARKAAIAFAIPGDIDLPTGGYGYDRRLLAEWQTMGVAARHLALPGSFPTPTQADLTETRRQLLSCRDDEALLIDGLAYGAFPESLAAGLTGRVVALVHHPLALETGLAAARADALRASERLALRHARAVVTTSAATKQVLASDYGLEAACISVAVPGVDAASRAQGGPADAPVQLLAVGSLIPRKGYDVLVEALGCVRSRDWRLTIAGSPDHAPETARQLQARIAAAGLQDHIVLAGAVDQTTLAGLYDRADLFVMPSLFEGYGMVLTEALARGLPIICTMSGAGADTVPSEAALKVPPGDAEALAKALASLIDAPAKRRRLAEAAWAAAGSLPRWRETAAIVAEACLADFGRKVL